MPEEVRPMLNAPAETDSAAAEELTKNAVARLNRYRQAQAELERALAKPTKLSMEHAQKSNQEFVARFSEMTGLSFDAEGRCTTPGIKMDDQFKERWARFFKKPGAEQPQQARELEPGH